MNKNEAKVVPKRRPKKEIGTAAETPPRKRVKKDPETVVKPPKKRLKVAKPENGETPPKLGFTPVVDPLEWTTDQLLAEQQSLADDIARNIVELFENGNTIPFIARYRRQITGNMSPEDLRNVKESYEEICHLKNKIKTALKSLEKDGNITDALRKSVITSRSLEELEYVCAPYKSTDKRSLAARAKELGLEAPAQQLLCNEYKVDLESFVDETNKDLGDLKEVETRVIHLLASLMATDTELLTFLRDLRGQMNFGIKTKKMVHKNQEKKPLKDSKKGANEEETKFDTYSDFEISSKYIKPHQILAINRGESLKILSVKVVVPDYAVTRIRQFCSRKWLNRGVYNTDRNRIITAAIEDSITRLIQPLIVRELRAQMKAQAHKASRDVFTTNLKQLLLAPPLKGRPILGIDPGFANGCKMALVSPLGEVLDHAIAYPHRNGAKVATDSQRTIKDLLTRHQCELIALGNGTACRPTEKWLSELIEADTFKPLNVKYTIVAEEGSSVYSCSVEAKKEFPTLDPNIISAVSLARRLQDPLAELVKIEPRHLGIGMYQHDLKKKQLEESLNEVVSECVSFVGADLNTASQCLLRHVAGLGDKKAAEIVAYRTKNGPFISRQQLRDLNGIGAKIFQQCSGFLRVAPLKADDSINFYKNPKTTRLDCTCIHPESYNLAHKLVNKLGLKLTELGTSQFITIVKNKLSTTLNLDELSTDLNTEKATVELILDALTKPLNHDFRTDSLQIPLFRQSLTNIEDLKCGTVLSGRINNVTHFGCFVDVGVGVNGLIHKSHYRGFELQIGNRVEVKVLNVEVARKRIGLEPIKIV